MTQTDLVMQSFEVAAERDGDVTQPVYERYFASCPGSRQLMSHIDGYVQGRMLEEVIELLLTADPAGLRDYLRFEMKTHLSYGVESTMYRNLFSAVRDVVRDALDSDWDAAYEQAWAQRTTALLAEIDVAAEAAAGATS